jgi:GGDEF domain-containing protein
VGQTYERGLQGDRLGRRNDYDVTVLGLLLAAFAVLTVLDLDDFKCVTDEHGHTGGA